MRAGGPASEFAVGNPGGNAGGNHRGNAAGGARGWRAALFALALQLAAAPTLAQDYRFNVIVELAADGAAPFEAAWATVRDALVENGYPFYTVVSESGAFRHFVSVVGDYGALEQVDAFRSQLEDSDRDDLRAALATLRSQSVAHHSYVSRHDRTLSYAPPGSYAGPYHRLETLRFAPAQRAPLARAFERLHAAWAAADIPSAFHVIWHTLGARGGEVTMLTSASSPAEHANREARVRTATGAAYEEFDAALWTLSLESRRRYWKSRPELTLTPGRQ